MPDNERAPITTHVLDQTTGLPAKNVRVTLALLDSSPFNSSGKPLTWEASTSADGRIATWNQGPDGAGPAEVINASKAEGQKTLRGNLTFQTGEYFGQGRTFYPEVVLSFVCDLTDQRDHWHVPLLLGPYGYTTYRGS